MLSIRQHGVEALTLRDVGARLRVSRTALYRHFADKTALLAAVAAEGFRAFRLAFVTAWESGGPGRAGFEAMGMAYVRFALEHPARAGRPRRRCVAGRDPTAPPSTDRPRA